jgi:hypothetical protein
LVKKPVFGHSYLPPDLADRNMLSANTTGTMHDDALPGDSIRTVGEAQSATYRTSWAAIIAMSAIAQVKAKVIGMK